MPRREPPIQNRFSNLLSSRKFPSTTNSSTNLISVYTCFPSLYIFLSNCSRFLTEVLDCAEAELDDDDVIVDVDADEGDEEEDYEDGDGIVYVSCVGNSIVIVIDICMYVVIKTL